MQTIATILNLQAMLLCLIFVGAAGKKCGVITEGFQSGLSRFLMNLILPCSVLNAFSKELDDSVWKQSAQILLIMLGVHAFYILLGMVLCRQQTENRKAVLRFAILCPNTNFMGMPVIGGIYGDVGILLLSVALFPVRAFVLTVGISYFVIGRSECWVLRLLKNPAIWAVAAGAVMMALRLRLPEPLDQAVSALAACTTPLSMVLIGGVVGDLKKEMLKDAAVWKFCMLRLLIIPLLVLGVLCALRLDPVASGVAVMMTALPAGAMTVIYTKEYQRDENFAAACVIFSTVLLVVTIPAIHFACTLLG